MSSGYLWVKAFHIVFVASWFAGLFYLPRLFVNLAMVPADSHAERERLLLMARKLYRFATLLMWPALALGLWLWLGYGIGGLAGFGEFRDHCTAPMPQRALTCGLVIVASHPNTGLAQTRARLHARERHRTRAHARGSGSTFTRDSLRLSVSRAILRAEPAFA